MTKFDDFVPEERDEQSQPLVSDLQRHYGMDAADQRSLAKIRERLLRSSEHEQATPIYLLERRERMQGMDSQPRVLARDSGRRERSNWRRRVALIAAAGIIVLLTGSLVLTLNLARQKTNGSGPKPSNPTGPLTIEGDSINISMINATEGWATGSGGVALHTQDGGVHWQDVSPPALQDLHKTIWRGGSQFLDASTAWITLTINKDNSHYYRPSNSSLVLHTTNGGRTWQQATLQTDGRAVSWLTFVDHQHGWLISRMESATHVVTGPGPVLPIAIYRTSDGGMTWQKVLNERGARAAIFKDVSINSISFADSQVGLITGATSTGSSLYRTIDGGATWKIQPWSAQLGHPTYVWTPRFFNNHDGLFMASFQERSSLAIYRTHDAGATWSNTPLLTLPKQPSRAGGLQSFAASGTFVDMQHGWILAIVAIDNSSQKHTKLRYYTSDGGLHWVLLSPGNDPFPDAFGIADYVSLTLGWMLEYITNPTTQEQTTALYKTTDGGRNWTLVQAHFPG